MSQATGANAVSDLERAEHLGYADSKGVKRVSIFNDGVQANVATEETLQAVLAATGGSTYTYIQSATTALYKYYGYYSATGWQIKRKTLATGVWQKATGLGDYDTAWADRANKTYSY
jgi:hypothetical protein